MEAGTSSTIVSRQSAFVTSNQNVTSASVAVAGGWGASHSARAFQRYCSDAEDRGGQGQGEHARRDHGAPSARAPLSRNSAQPGRSRIIDR